MLWSDDELPLWKPPGDHVAARYVAEKTAWRDRQMQEYRRLLYVGLTRAQDRLYICGWQTLRAPQQICWHTLCHAGLRECAQPFAFDTKPLIGEVEGWSGDGLRIESPQTVPPHREPAMAAAAGRSDAVARLGDGAAAGRAGPAATIVAVKAGRRGAADPVAARDRRTRPVQARPPGPSAVAKPARAAGDRARRGGPALSGLADSRPFSRGAGRDPPRNPGGAEPSRFRGICSVRDSQAEVPLVGLVGRHALSGQIDRLVVAPDHVLIVDYKTLRPVPANEAEVAPDLSAPAGDL